jgi:uncharacterized protein (DUF2225 family)
MITISAKCSFSTIKHSWREVPVKLSSSNRRKMRSHRKSAGKTTTRSKLEGSSTLSRATREFRLQLMKRYSFTSSNQKMTTCQSWRIA